MMNRYFRYLLWELFKSLFMATLVSLVVLLGLQFLRLSELIVRFDVELELIAKMVMGLGTSFLPLVLPISFLFAALSTFGRLSVDKEFVAFLSMGVGPKKLLRPCLLLAFLLSLVTLWTSFYIGPKGNRMFEEFVDEAFRKKVTSSLRSGTFAESFLGLVIFVDKVDSTMTKLERVFIHDEQSYKESVSISAREGTWVQKEENGSYLGILGLRHGILVSQNPEAQSVRRIEFDEYNIFTDFNRHAGRSRDSPPSLDGPTLFKMRNDAQLQVGLDARPIWSEIAKRMALAFVPLLFGPLAFFLSFETGRTVKSRSVFLGLLILLLYWTLYFTLVTFAMKSSSQILVQEEILTHFIVWIPNFILFFAALYFSKMRIGKSSKSLTR